MTPRTKAGADLQADIRELAEAFHQVGSLRDHADPNDKTGWNLHGIETCADPYCLDALAAGVVIRAIEDEMLDKVAAAVEGLQHAERQMWGPDERPTIVVADVLAAIEDIRKEASDGR